MRSADLLVVNRQWHAAEVARFHSHVVCGPTPSDCNIWTGVIGAGGYGRFDLTRDGVGLCVRACASLRVGDGDGDGRRLCSCGGARMDECDNPVCVKVAVSEDVRQHVVSSSQDDNLERMARMRRGGGRPAVRHGWDAAAVQVALLGDQPTL